MRIRSHSDRKYLSNFILNADLIEEISFRHLFVSGPSNL